MRPARSAKIDAINRQPNAEMIHVHSPPVPACVSTNGSVSNTPVVIDTPENEAANDENHPISRSSCCS